MIENVAYNTHEVLICGNVIDIRNIWTTSNYN